MTATGLMKSQALAADRLKTRQERAAEAAARLDPDFPYAAESFPDGFGATEDNEGEQAWKFFTAT